MPHYQKLYSFLFGKVTDAIEALEQNRGEQAKDILIRASREAEDMYIDSDPEDAEYPTKPMSKELFETLLDKCCADRDSDTFAALCEKYPGLDERCDQELMEKIYDRSDAGGAGTNAGAVSMDEGRIKNALWDQGKPGSGGYER